MKPPRRAVAEVLHVLDVERADRERHAEVVAGYGHRFSSGN
jgi:hypothetical protein